LLHEALRLLLPLLNLSWIGVGALPRGLDQELMGTLDPLLGLVQWQWLYHLRLWSHTGSGKPRYTGPLALDELSIHATYVGFFLCL